MPKPRSVTSYVAEIRGINRRFRKLGNKDGPVAEKLMGDKDRLIDEMAALCPHPAVLAVRGSKGRRICPRCGFCEGTPTNTGYKILTGRPTVHLSIEDYLLREGLLLRRLGINI